MSRWPWRWWPPPARADDDIIRKSIFPHVGTLWKACAYSFECTPPRMPLTVVDNMWRFRCRTTVIVLYIPRFDNIYFIVICIRLSENNNIICVFILAGRRRREISYSNHASQLYTHVRCVCYRMHFRGVLPHKHDGGKSGKRDRWLSGDNIRPKRMWARATKGDRGRILVWWIQFLYIIFFKTFVVYRQPVHRHKRQTFVRTTKINRKRLDKKCKCLPFSGTFDFGVRHYCKTDDNSTNPPPPIYI